MSSSSLTNCFVKTFTNPVYDFMNEMLSILLLKTLQCRDSHLHDFCCATMLGQGSISGFLGFVNFFTTSSIHTALFHSNHQTWFSPVLALCNTTISFSIVTKFMWCISFVHHRHVVTTSQSSWPLRRPTTASWHDPLRQKWISCSATFLCSWTIAADVQFQVPTFHLYWSAVTPFQALSYLFWAVHSTNKVMTPPTLAPH